MKRLKAIWNILICDEFFLATYYNDYRYDKIKYIHPKFSKYFADAIKEWIDGVYDKLPKFKE